MRGYVATGFVGRKTELALLHKRLTGVTASGAGPVAIVLDEPPWLAEQDEIFDGALQTALGPAATARMPISRPRPAAGLARCRQGR
jgi:hypothetical protein